MTRNQIIQFCQQIRTFTKSLAEHPLIGGFQVNGVVYNHTSPHMKGTLPTGGDVGYKDGHAEWRKFNVMTPRVDSGNNDAIFWW